MIMAIEQAIAVGLAARAACAAVELSERRFRRWRVRAREGDYTRHRKPADVRPINALTPEEHEAIREAVACAEWADLSCRELSIKILETQELYISHVAIWEYERTQGLAGHRGKRRLMGRHRGAAPDTSFVQGPNQLWTWDFTKAPTGIPHQCWYLVAVEDQYSRKVVGWAMGARATTELAKVAWDAALLAEGGTSEAMPFSLSDRGPRCAPAPCGSSSRTWAWRACSRGRGPRTTIPTSSRSSPRSRPIRPILRPSPPDRKSTRLNSSHIQKSRMPSSA